MTFGISLRELASVGEHVADNASRTPPDKAAGT